MSPFKKSINPLLLLIFFVFLCFLFFQGCTEPPKPKPAQAVKAFQIADPGEFAKRSFPGRAAAGQEVNLSFRISGPLIELLVNPGDKVKKGDVLARIDPTDFNVRLTSARSSLSAAKAGYRRANADYKRLRNAQKEDPGSVSQRVVDLALANKEQTASAVKVAQANTKTMEDRLSYTWLKAPFSGEIVETYVENYETIVAKQPILRLLNPSSIEMTLSLPENLIGFVEYITDIKVKFDALPGVEVPARIFEIGREASLSTHTFPLTISMNQIDSGKILPGMAGDADITAILPEYLRKRLYVPPSSLFAGIDSKKSYVWIIKNNQVQQRNVEVGALSGRGIIINSGIHPGEWIVAAGVHALTQGQKVRIINKGDKK